MALWGNIEPAANRFLKDITLGKRGAVAKFRIAKITPRSRKIGANLRPLNPKVPHFAGCLSSPAPEGEGKSRLVGVAEQECDLGET